jgi:hypothetical protein
MTRAIAAVTCLLKVNNVSKIEQLASFIKIVECGGLIRAAEAYLHKTASQLNQ